jgi:Na+(H+)/acetate symporter ActP
MRALHTVLPATAAPKDRSRPARWLAVAATVLATTVAVLLASFVAVVVGLS